MNQLNVSVTQLTGIGAQTAQRLERLGIRIIQDLVFHLPIRYEDRTRVVPIGSLMAGMTALIRGRVEFIDVLPRGRKGLVCRISDDTGSISLKFFHFSAHQHNSLKPGTLISCFAEVRHSYAGLEMTHPDYQILFNPETSITETRLTPVYPLTEGLSQTTIRKAVKQALTLCENQADSLIDWIPETILKKQAYPSLAAAIQTLHAPDESVTLTALENGTVPALKRLAFEELLTHQLSMQKAKNKAKAWRAPSFFGDDAANALFLNNLPFKLTGAQQRVIAEIAEDCLSTHPMMRLVQGDVGSGKTIVAAYAALLALSAGYQVAVMAPTELLAEQHKRNFSNWFQGFQTQVVYLTGQLKGNARKEALLSLADGTAGIIVGTHALFQDSVNFHRLGLIIIDEQHRFGVHQRMALREKGQQEDSRPHQLVMTATPIPRTLAMLQYSDLDISIIDDVPHKFSRGLIDYIKNHVENHVKQTENDSKEVTTKTEVEQVTS